MAVADLSRLPTGATADDFAVAGNEADRAERRVAARSLAATLAAEAATASVAICGRSTSVDKEGGEALAVPAPAFAPAADRATPCNHGAWANHSLLLW